MTVSFNGIGQVNATFLGEGLAENTMVKMSGSGTVAACADGDSFCGKTLCCKDDACTVQVGGFLTVGYSGTAPALGWTALAADGAGGVKSASGGRTYLVAAVDTVSKTVTIML